MERKSFAVGAVDALGRKLPLEAKKRADKMHTPHKAVISKY